MGEGEKESVDRVKAGTGMIQLVPSIMLKAARDR
jgi:hypothetical protein